MAPERAHDGGDGRPLPAVADLVAVMDRLRSPGGCPWDREQTHRSLLPYLLEECYELVEAVEAGDRQAVREELGDVLLQVVFHARLAQEDPTDPFGVDEVAAQVAAKLRRRHPHVFADVVADTPAQVAENWRRIKAAEKPDRVHAADGVPSALPALERASKLLQRLDGAGQAGVAALIASGPGVGAGLLALVVQAHSQGIDPAAALRDTLRAVERAAADGDPGGEGRPAGLASATGLGVAPPGRG